MNITFKTLYLGLFIFLINCATFNKKSFKKELDRTKKNTIHAFSGSYEINPISEFHDRRDKFLSSEFEDINLFQEIENNREYCSETDSSIFMKNSSVSIEILKNDSIKILFFHERSSFSKEMIVKAYFKKDEFLYLGNVYKECKGIPYLFGGCRHYKIRLGIDIENNLILNKAVCDESAVLFFFGGGRRYNVAYKFNRLD